MSRPRLAALVVGHGSRLPGFETAMRRVAGGLRRAGWDRVECAYLEIAKPGVREAIDELAAAGAAEVRVLPYFVQMGRHVREDLPLIVREAAAFHRGRCRVLLRPYLGYDPLIVRLAAKRLGRPGRRP